MNYRYINIGSYTAAFVALLDQISKFWVLYHSDIPQQQTMYVNDYLNFVLNWNKGITFGIFNGENPLSSYVFTAIAVAIVVYLFVWLWEVASIRMAVAIGMVIGGAIGNNVVDRMQHGAVLDFIDVHIGGYHWYVFNLADSAIVCGVCLLMLEHLLNPPKNGSEQEKT